MNYKSILYIGFGLIIFMMVIIIAIIISTFNNQNQQMNELVNDRYNKIELANQVRYEIGTIAIEDFSKLEAKDSQSIQQSFEKINFSLKQLESFLHNERAQKLLMNLNDQYFTFRNSFNEILSYKSNNMDIPKHLIHMTINKQSTMLSEVEELIFLQEEVMKETLLQAKNNYASAIKVVIITLIAGAILTVIKVYLVIHIISRRLKRLKNVISTLNDDQYSYVKIDELSNDEIGEIAKAYNEIATSLAKQEKLEQEYRERIENQNWLKTRIAELSVLTQGVNDLHITGDRLIQKLAQAVDASFGILYIINKDDKEYLQRIASYAFSENIPTGFGKDQFFIGEGLVGQSAKTKETIFLKNVTNDYIQISSGLGHTRPKNIMILPILLEDEVLGVVELATLKDLSDLQQAFLEESASFLGTTLNRILKHIQVQELLKESQILNEELQTQSEELQLQQEELRTMNDEIEAQYQNSELKTKELEEIKENLEQKTKEIIMSSKYKSEFMANMSHELRTPLNSLLILAQMLLENKDQNLNQKQLEYANTIFTSGHDLLQLINDILDLTKIESGKLEIIEGEVLLSDIFTSLDRQFMPLAKKKELAFTYDKDTNLSDIIYTDEQRLNQILKNLLSNAIKFTEKGHVHLQVSSKQKDNVSYLTFSVTDSGIGIPSNKVSIIFEAFRQADGTTSRKYGGTGLGLSICEELAKLLHGHITCESIEGEGSTFTLYIPYGEEKQVTTELEPTISLSTETTHSAETTELNIPLPNLSGKRVLVVDDDMRNIFALTSSLEAAGMEVTFAENGKEAITLLEENGDTDIILMDIMMPEMDGYEAMNKIRSMKQFEDLPIIALTAKAMKDDHQKCIEAGATDYITKPVNLEQLFSIIHVWLHN
jgi:two-component system, chemotaxis family, sensor kinase CheA